jgi:hypothetical protein
MNGRRWLASAAGAVCTTGCAALLGYGDPVEIASEVDADVDASVPDSRPADTSALSFCESRSPKPTFCSSFDGPSLLSDWGGSSAVETRLERDAVQYVSGPASMKVTLARTRPPTADVTGAASVDFAAFADKDFTATIGFDLRVDAAAPTNSLAVISTPIVISRPGGPTYLLQLVCRPLADGSTVSLASVEVVPGQTSVEHTSSRSLQMKTWAHVDLVVTLGPQRRAKLSVDGATGYDGPLSLSAASGVPGSSFGISTVDLDATAWSFNLDNVTVDLR